MYPIDEELPTSAPESDQPENTTGPEVVPKRDSGPGGLGQKRNLKHQDWYKKVVERETKWRLQDCGADTDVDEGPKPL